MANSKSASQEATPEENLERYRRLFLRAEESVDYWVGVPIVEFSEDVWRLMEEQQVSRAELARRLGTSRAYVTKLLGGNANFTLHTMTKVAMALGAAVHVHVADKDAETHWRDKPTSREILPGASPAAKTKRKAGPRKKPKSATHRV